MKNPKHSNSILSLLFVVFGIIFIQSCIEQGSVGEIEIDVTQTGEPISPNLFGHNLEHTRNGIWQGISAEMIANRKFAAVQGDLPERWKAIAYSGKASVDRNTVYVGNHSVRLENQGAATVAIAQQHEWLSFEEGKKYVFRVWIKSDLEQTLWMGIRDRYSTRDWVIREETLAMPGDWRLWSGEFVAPMTLEEARFELGNSGKGTAWIGAVSLMPAGNFHGMRVDVVEKLKSLKPGNLRWPGGCFAEYYKWEEGLLPVDQRPPIGPALWVGLLPDTDDYDMHEIGIDEFIALCRELECEPHITIPYGRSVPEEAASWVEYCNGDKDTKWGKIRAERGHPKPYRVKRWYVGNEIWGVSLVEDKDPEMCALVSAEFIRAMKKSDPQIEVIGCSPATNPAARALWLAPLMNEAGDVMDLVQEGWYFPYWAGTDDVFHAPVRDILPLLRSMRAYSDSLSQALSVKNKGIVFYEWNVSWGLSGDVLSGLFAAGMLNMFCREFESLDLVGASYFMPVNEGAIKVGPSSCSFDTDGEVFQMYAAHQNNQVLHLDTDELEQQNLDACASISPDGKMVFITVISTETLESQVFNFSIKNADTSKSVQSLSLIPENFEIGTSTFRKEEKKLQQNNNSMKVELAPGSITRLCFEIDAK